jgi:NADPH:quinone reductase-like Zn-dependent oxidoreductase
VEIERPEPRPNEVLVRVRAAGVNPTDWKHRATGGFLGEPPFVLGWDVSGVVEAVGIGVAAFAPGDEVFGSCEGSFAEYACAKADKLAPMPANLTFEQAAAVPVSGVTALQALRDKGRVQAGQRVLVIGASGGVGGFAVQIAKAVGAEVTGVASTAKLDAVRALGADSVVDYTREDVASLDERFDVILDIAGNRSLRQLRRILTPHGRLVIVGGETGGKWLDGLDRQLRAVLLNPFVGQQLGFFVNKENAADLRALTELVEAGRVRPRIDRTYPLRETPEALRYLEKGHARGKVVITV